MIYLLYFVSVLGFCSCSKTICMNAMGPNANKDGNIFQ